MSALEDVAAERRRQVEAEGWTPEHDDAHPHGDLAHAAASYAMHAGYRDRDRCSPAPPAHWPWSRPWWKPTTRRGDLVKAGALILAEIERLDRAEAKGQAAAARSREEAIAEARQTDANLSASGSSLVTGFPLY